MKSRSGPLKNGDSELRVCNKQCDQCLYTKHKIVSDKRRDEILYQLDQVGDFFICHKGSLVDERIMCRGYYEANKHSSLLIKLGHVLKLIFFVDVVEIMRHKINTSRAKAKSMKAGDFGSI